MKQKIAEILLNAQIIDRYVEDSEINKAVDEILELFKENSPIYWCGGKIKSWEEE